MSRRFAIALCLSLSASGCDRVVGLAQNDDVVADAAIPSAALTLVLRGAGVTSWSGTIDLVTRKGEIVSRSFVANGDRLDVDEGSDVLALTLWVPGHAGYSHYFEHDTPREFAVEMQCGATLAVRVLDDEGMVRRGWPLQLVGARVHYRHALGRMFDGDDCTTTTKWDGPHRTDGLAKADADGVATFLHVMPGTYSLQAPQLARWSAQEVRVADLVAGEVRGIDIVVPAAPPHSWGGVRFPLEGTGFEVSYDGAVRNHTFWLENGSGHPIDVVDGEVWVVVNGEHGAQFRGRIEPPRFVPARWRLERDGATCFTSELIEFVVGAAPEQRSILRDASPR